MTVPPTFNNSSDPAVFSSDDDPSVENYTQGRRKRIYVGSWYQQQPASSDSGFSDFLPAAPKPTRKWARQMDSGVYMGSDGAESEDLDGFPSTAQMSLADLPMSPQEELEAEAVRRVQDCVDKGDENIELS